MTPDEALTGDIGTDPAERAKVLAAEVTRLREELDESRGENRRVIHVTTALLTGADPEKALVALKEWETELPALRSKLASIEAWYHRSNSSDHDDLLDAMDELGNTILRERQTGRQI